MGKNKIKKILSHDSNFLKTERNFSEKWS